MRTAARTHGTGLISLGSRLPGTAYAGPEPMFYLLLAQIVSLLLDLCAVIRRAERHKDLQILLLRQHLRMLQRHHPKQPRLSRWEKLTLAVLAGTRIDFGSSAKANWTRCCPCSSPPRSYVGTAISSVARGPSTSDASPVDQQLIPRSKRCCCAWPKQTRVGASATSKVSCATSAMLPAAQR